ncbi:hypothetical protein GF324_09240 [bacterium]|nr:hypothetical protein [bacterium]
MFEYDNPIRHFFDEPAGGSIWSTPSFVDQVGNAVILHYQKVVGTEEAMLTVAETEYEDRATLSATLIVIDHRSDTQQVFIHVPCSRKPPFNRATRERIREMVPYLHLGWPSDWEHRYAHPEPKPAPIAN